MGKPMPKEGSAMTPKDRMRQYVERLDAKGMTRVTVVVPKGRVDELKRYAAELRGET